MMFPPFHATANTVLRSLKSVCHGGFVKDGADYAKDNFIKGLVFGLRCIVDDEAREIINRRESRLENQTGQITHNIFHASPSEDAAFKCTVVFGSEKFELIQKTLSSDIEIIDLQTGEKAMFEGVNFAILKKCMLEQYVAGQKFDLTYFNFENNDLGEINFNQVNLDKKNRDIVIEFGGSLNGVITDPISDLTTERLVNYISIQRAQGNFPIELGLFDLTGMDLSGVDFRGAELSRENLIAIIVCNGDISGATLSSDINVSDLSISGVRLDKAMVEALIRSGVCAKSVMKSYLATPSSSAHICHIKAHMLNNYLDELRSNKKSIINLDKFSLSNLDVKSIDFSRVKLNQTMLNSVIAHGGNLTGAILAEGVSIGRDVTLDDVYMDKAMAIQLINAGANRRAVLIRYLETERGHQRVHIDIDGIDLKGVNPLGLNLDGVQWEWTMFEALPQITNQFKEKIQANFEHDVLAMLGVYSRMVAATLLKSSTLDIKNDASFNVTDTHDYVIEDHVRTQPRSLGRMISSIKTSSGNCGEMAVMCKALIDSYLKNSLKAIGYQSVEVSALAFSAVAPFDHRVIFLECTFNGRTVKYIIDPWNDGKAWKEDVGMTYLRKTEGWAISFIPNERLNRNMDKPANRAGALDAFANFKVKQQLDSDLKHVKFRGMPLK